MADGLEFLDTNLVIRYVTQDHPDLAHRAGIIFEQLAGGVLSVTTTEAVIAEVVHVLSSPVLYRLSRDEIRFHLTNILALPGLRLAGKAVYLEALDLYTSTRLDFLDCLCVARMREAGIDTILSFDRDFDRVPGIQRHEP